MNAPAPPRATCPRCGGWLYHDPDPSEPQLVCINCGYRPPVPLAGQYPITLPEFSRKLPREGA